MQDPRITTAIVALIFFAIGFAFGACAWQYGDPGDRWHLGRHMGFWLAIISIVSTALIG